ncbi:MAG: hypothetical protein NC191_02305 [Muribaculaceae bacterium]|nr:hypothetical protein [Muribaculaceae bacterium]
MGGVKNCNNKNQGYNYCQKPVEQADATRTKSPVAMPSSVTVPQGKRIDKPDFMDKLKNDYPFPDWAADMVPEEILLLSSSRCHLVNESVEDGIKNLPKKADGSVDVDKIKEALKTAVDFIKKSNAAALEKINHGIYGQQANNINIIGQVFGPETAALLEWAGFDVDKFNSDFSVHQSDFMGKIIADMHVKDSGEIEHNIKSQNAKLDELLQLDLNKPENLEKLITGYKDATGTSFSVDRIMDSQKSGLSKDVKLQKSVASFGMQESLIDSYKNKVASDAWVLAVEGTVSAILANSSNPIVKAIGNVLPYHMELVELLTRGRKDGELINKVNISWKNLANAYLDATKIVVVNNIPLAGNWILRVLQKMGINLSNIGFKAGVGTVVS